METGSVVKVEPLNLRLKRERYFEPYLFGTLISLDRITDFNNMCTKCSKLVFFMNLGVRFKKSTSYRGPISKVITIV